jgi:hypothetical protein
MLEEISDWFSELDGQRVGIAFLLWAACLLILWKLMYDPQFMSMPIKIILSIVMLPICFVILQLMSSD